MRRVAPVWRDLAFRIDTYKPTKEYWGWVLEMWAFTIACSQQEPPVGFELHPEFMLQTPWDRTDKINVCEDGEALSSFDCSAPPSLTILFLKGNA